MAATKKAIKNPVPTELDAEGKMKALATAMSQIERDFGAPKRPSVKLPNLRYFLKRR